MAIRYDKKLNQEINRTIKNFNQKIARLEKEERELLPSKITKKELKSSVYNRTELRRKLKELQQFSTRGVEDVIETSGGARLTKYDYQNIKRENARIKRNITREINRLKIEKPKIFGKIQSSTFSEMGDTDYLNLVARRKALEKDINKLLRHAYILTTILACWDNNLMETGSGYGRTAGHIRFYCNGFIDFVDEFWRDIKGV